ncbi:2318_t:CDS:1, partial [Paraglomus occultum]
AAIPLNETQNLSLSRRQAETCTDPHYPVWRSAHCKTETTILHICEATDFPGSYTSIEQPCPQESVCVDFIRPDSTPIAACLSKSSREQWNNDPDRRGILCSNERSFRVGANVLTFGMTTYDANANPIQVEYLDVSVNGHALMPSWNDNHYTKIYNNYVANQLIKFCFMAGSDALVTAFAWALVPGTNNGLMALDLE